MSNTTSLATDEHVSPQRAFDRLVWDNPRVCNGCFEHVREIDEATISGGVYDHDVEDRHRTPQASLEQDNRIITTVDGGSGSARARDAGDSVTRPGQQRSGVPRTTCRTCARVGCWAESETLSKTQALRLTTPLVRRLQEQGLEFDEHALRRAVRLFKEHEDAQGYDTEIFRRSTKLAVKRG